MSKRVIGSNYFAQSLSQVDFLAENEKNVSCMVYKHIRVNLRSRPSESAYILAKTGLENCYFKVLGKYKEITTSDPDGYRIWYYVKLIHNIEDYNYSETGKIATAGSTVFFVKKNIEPVLTASFKKFYTDLSIQNKLFSLDQTSESRNDTLNERITRFRQRGHSSNVDLFDDVIGHDVDDTVYMDEIPYSGGSNALVTFAPNDTLTIDTNIQLYNDYSVVEFNNRKKAEIQHLFVGLDVIDNPIDPQSVYATNIGNNIYASLFCGDAGSVSGDLLDKNDPPVANEARKSIKILFERANANLTIKTDDYFDYFMNTRFDIHDQLGDIYCFRLNQIKKKFTNVSDLPKIFLTFNSELINGKGELKAIDAFIDFIGFDKLKKLSDLTQNTTKRIKIENDAYKFSDVWYDSKLGNYEPNAGKEIELRKYSVKAINIFLETLDKIRASYDK